MHWEARILTPIAKTQQMATTWAKTLFSMSQEKTDATDQDQYKKLRAAGVEHPVAMAYQMTAPLLMENEAISRHIETTGNLDLRRILPELTTVAEAVSLAIAEYQLTKPQTTTLTTMLRRLSTSTPSAPSKNAP